MKMHFNLQDVMKIENYYQKSYKQNIIFTIHLFFSPKCDVTKRDKNVCHKM